MASTARNRHVRNIAQGVRVVGGYLRLSVDRDGHKIGYDVQRAAISNHAAQQGWLVVWYQDSDLTAASEDVVRPEYERMLADLTAHRISGIVVWKLDRLVRLAYEFERCVRLVRKAGGFIADVEQGYNTESPIGEIVMRILVMVAQMEIANMRARQKGHQQMKARRGEYSGGGVRPFGFVGPEYGIGEDGKPLDGKEGRKRVITNRGQIGVRHVTEEVELLRDAAKRIVAGATYGDVLADWAQRTPPVLGTRGKPMYTDTLAEILTSYRAAGLRTLEEEDPVTGKTVVQEFKAVWEPILDRATWERLRALRAVRSEFNPKAVYLLNGGIAVCGFPEVEHHGCGKRLHGAQKFGRVWDGKTYKASGDAPRVLWYQCEETRPAKMKGHCGSTRIKARETEEVVVEALCERLEASPVLLDIAAEADNSVVEAELRKALEEVETCNRSLADLSRRVALRSDDPDWLDDVEWAAQRSSFRARKAAAAQTVERAKKQMVTPIPMGDDRDNVREWFDRLELGQKRVFLRRFLLRVEIGPSVRGATTFTPGRVRPCFADAEHLRGEGQQ